MAQQTAVEWLENELKKIPFINPKEAFEQAKQMEVEQTEISDEEITKQGFLHSYLNELPDENAISFIQGAKWYR